MKTVFPENEAERLKSLRRYQILDTPPEPAFERIPKWQQISSKCRWQPSVWSTRIAYGSSRASALPPSRQRVMPAYAPRRSFRRGVYYLRDAAKDERTIGNPIRDTASLSDPLSQELLTVREKSLTSDRWSFSSLEQNIPRFSLMFVLLTLLFSVSLGLREEEVWGTSTRLRVAPVPLASLLGGKLLAPWIIGPRNCYCYCCLVILSMDWRLATQRSQSWWSRR
jgi:hypothetical protein